MLDKVPNLIYSVMPFQTYSKAPIHGRVITSCPHGNDEYGHENANIWMRDPKMIDLKTYPCNPGRSFTS